MHRDAAMQRELEGVRQEIENDFLPHFPVDVDGSGQRLTLDQQVEPRALDRRAKRAGEVTGQAGEVHRLIRRVHTAGFDPGKVQQRVDELLEPKRIAVRELEPLPDDRRRLHIGEHLLDGREQQGQGRPELVRNVGEEGGLGAVEFRERFRPLALRLIGARVRNCRGDLPGDELEEALVLRVQHVSRTHPGHKDARELMGDVRLDGHSHRGVWRVAPGTRRDKRPARRQGIDHLKRLARQHRTQRRCDDVGIVLATKLHARRTDGPIP